MFYWLFLGSTGVGGGVLPPIRRAHARQREATRDARTIAAQVQRLIPDARVGEDSRLGGWASAAAAPATREAAVNGCVGIIWHL